MGATSAHAITDGGRQNRVFDRERLERDATDFCGRTLFDQMSIFDATTLQCLPGFLRRMHRAGRAFLQAPGVVRMRMRKHDRAGMQPLKFSQPIEAAVNHHGRATMGNQQRSVHAMPPRPRCDLAPCTKEGEFHRTR
jgi:hypothetical protein